MACCVFTAYLMSRIIKACEILDLDLLNIQYNDAHEESRYGEHQIKKAETTLSRFSIHGMTCAACSSAIEHGVKSLDGVEAVTVSLTLSRATVAHQTTLVSPTDIVGTINGLGYTAHCGERTAQENLELVEQASELKELKNSFGSALSLGMLMFSIEQLDWLVTPPPFVETLRNVILLVLGFWIQIVVAYGIHRKAWRNGMFSEPSMDTLISLSLILGSTLSIISYTVDEWHTTALQLSSGSFLAIVIIGGRCLDSLLRRQIATSLASLYSLQNRTNHVRMRRSADGSSTLGQSHQPQLIPAMMLKPGDEIYIEPGSVIPVDCYITSGRSIVNQAAMTGEPLPIARSTGDFLMSGTDNISSELVAIVTKSQEDSALEHLISSVSNATDAKVDDAGTGFITSVFVRVILLISMTVAVMRYMTCPVSMSLIDKLIVAGEKAMAILASACPCALGLASPSAVMSGISVAWSRGIIFRGGTSTIEQLDKLTHMVVDKTGTLTTGKLSVSSIEGAITSEDHMLICAVEREPALTHPVARIIFQWSLSQLDEKQRRLQNNVSFDNLQSELGKGVYGKTGSSDAQIELQHREIHIGTAAFLEQSCIPLPLSSRNQSRDKITVYVAIDRKYTASINLQDTIRAEAPSVISHLKSNLNLSLTMLTGDGAAEASRVSMALNIEVLSSQTLPHQKREYIECLQSRSPTNRVAMVGDGLNDAPALSAANVGILLSHGFSQASKTCVQLADVILTTSSLTGVVDAVLIAQATAKQVRWNIRWAMTYNVIAVALAVGLLEPWGVEIDAATAGTMMAFSSVSVMGWSLWFRRRLGTVGFEFENV